MTTSWLFHSFDDLCLQIITYPSFLKYKHHTDRLLCSIFRSITDFNRFYNTHKLQNSLWTYHSLKRYLKRSAVYLLSAENCNLCYLNWRSYISIKCGYQLLNCCASAIHSPVSHALFTLTTPDSSVFFNDGNHVFDENTSSISLDNTASWTLMVSVWTLFGLCDWSISHDRVADFNFGSNSFTTFTTFKKSCKKNYPSNYFVEAFVKVSIVTRNEIFFDIHMIIYGWTFMSIYIIIKMVTQTDNNPTLNHRDI